MDFIFIKSKIEKHLSSKDLIDRLNLTSRVNMLSFQVLASTIHGKNKRVIQKQLI